MCPAVGVDDAGARGSLTSIRWLILAVLFSVVFEQLNCELGDGVNSCLIFPLPRFFVFAFGNAPRDKTDFF